MIKTQNIKRKILNDKMIDEIGRLIRIAGRGEFATANANDVEAASALPNGTVFINCRREFSITRYKTVNRRHEEICGYNGIRLLPRKCILTTGDFQRYESTSLKSTLPGRIHVRPADGSCAVGD
jgi:hypothetical protein